MVGLRGMNVKDFHTIMNNISITVQHLSTAVETRFFCDSQVTCNFSCCHCN